MKRQLTVGSLWVVLLSVQVGNVYCRESFSALAGKHGTDKGPRWHNYTRIYEKYFAAIRDEPIKLLEIGFLKGQSARMWREYFPNAELHFIDVEPSKFTTYGSDLADSCFFHVADQQSPEDLSGVIERCGGEFDIIVDDGGHTMQQQLVSFRELFPHLKSGGVYVIEDLHTSYWRDMFGGGGTRQRPRAGAGTTIGFLQQLVDDVNYINARIGCADVDKNIRALEHELFSYQKHVASLHFYPGLCFIFKR